jgi:hypothetical protein
MKSVGEIALFVVFALMAAATFAIYKYLFHDPFVLWAGGVFAGVIVSVVYMSVIVPKEE